MTALRRVSSDAQDVPGILLHQHDEDNVERSQSEQDRVVVEDVQVIDVRSISILQVPYMGVEEPSYVDAGEDQCLGVYQEIEAIEGGRDHPQPCAVAFVEHFPVVARGHLNAAVQRQADGDGGLNHPED